MIFLFNDQIDWNTEWYPTHLVSAFNSAIPVFIGVPKTFIMGYIGVYIKDSDLKNIDLKKPYILIHDPEPNMDDIKIDWEEIPNKQSEGEHLHIYKEGE
jgi:hypothetical protein